LSSEEESKGVDDTGHQRPDGDGWMPLFDLVWWIASEGHQIELAYSVHNSSGQSRAPPAVEDPARLALLCDISKQLENSLPSKKWDRAELEIVEALARALVRFEDGKLVEQHIQKIASGQKLPPREQLGHQDPAKWEKDPSGQPKDPWVEQWYLPLVGLEDDEVRTFVTGSKGGIGAIARLCNVYGRRYGDGTLPIVALKVRSYKHKQFGRVETPDLEVVGWDGTPMPKRSAGEELNDEVPF
jgi:hypothetical protein